MDAFEGTWDEEHTAHNEPPEPVMSRRTGFQLAVAALMATIIMLPILCDMENQAKERFDELEKTGDELLVRRQRLIDRINTIIAAQRLPIDDRLRQEILEFNYDADSFQRAMDENHLSKNPPNVPRIEVAEMVK